MISESGDGSYSIVSCNSLPHSANPLISGMSMSAPIPAYSIGNAEAVNYVSGHSSITYDMKPGSQNALRALLFLATEKERYQKFCKSIDEEITEELGTNEV